LKKILPSRVTILSLTILFNNFVALFEYETIQSQRFRVAVFWHNLLCYHKFYKIFQLLIGD